MTRATKEICDRIDEVTDLLERVKWAVEQDLVERPDIVLAILDGACDELRYVAD